MVKLARENGRDYEPKNIPPLELAQNLMAKTEESKNAMRITNNFYNIVKIKDKGQRDETSDNDYDNNDEELKRRAEQEKQEQQKKRDDEEYQQRIKQSVENQNKLKDEDHQTKMMRYKDHLDKFTDKDHQKKVRHEQVMS